ncbi:DUF2911 domain-containing protein [Aquimarina addita]|uniref:DUF2911 domain-containing protein n=1 Tax=Aquimarina addita TaxID=870485 RepID=A0ABP6UVK6_9FLAO
MKIKIVLFLLFTFILYDGQAQIGRLQLSPFQETKIKIGTTDIIIAYSRPSMRGREIFGHLVPFDQWWRTGANRNTTIEFSEDVIIGEKRIDKGKYAIFSRPNQKEWKILFYKKTDNWDVPEVIDPSHIAATMVVNSTKTENTSEVLSVHIGDFTNYKFDLNIAWDQTKVTVPVKLITEEIMEQKISKTLNGPLPHDYYSAALYEMESGGNFERGLTWIDSAIQMREQTSWWDLRVKAILMINLNKKKEAMTVAKIGLELAKKENHEYGINEMNRIVNQFKE